MILRNASAMLGLAHVVGVGGGRFGSDARHVRLNMYAHSLTYLLLTYLLTYFTEHGAMSMVQ